MFILAAIEIVSGLFLAGFIALIIAFIAWSIWHEKKRTEALASAAESMGFQLLPASHSLPSPDVSHFNLFSRGNSRRVSNMMQAATDELRTSIFDYRYKTGHGKNARTFQQTVVHLESSGLHLPSFALRPENLLDKIGGMIGLQDIDFATHPTFSKMFVLKGADESAIRELFGDELLSFLEGQAGLAVDACGNHLVLYRAGYRIAPAELQAFMALAFRVRTQLASRCGQTGTSI